MSDPQKEDIGKLLQLHAQRHADHATSEVVRHGELVVTDSGDPVVGVGVVDVEEVEEVEAEGHLLHVTP